MSPSLQSASPGFCRGPSRLLCLRDSSDRNACYGFDKAERAKASREILVLLLSEYWSPSMNNKQAKVFVLKGKNHNPGYVLLLSLFRSLPISLLWCLLQLHCKLSFHFPSLCEIMANYLESIPWAQRKASSALRLILPSGKCKEKKSQQKNVAKQGTAGVPPLCQ